VNLVFGIIEFLLTLRFIFKFFIVNSSNPFVAWIYSTSDSLVAPFAGIVTNLKLGGFLVDFAVLIAMIVYTFVGYLILQAFSYVAPRYYRNN
jgi:uncharacterized protein YggT (Ycf19 family)